LFVSDYDRTPFFSFTGSSQQNLISNFRINLIVYGAIYMTDTKTREIFYPEKFESVIRDICEIIRTKEKFLICGHISPDGDCIGSQMALYFLLKQMGKTVQLFNAGPVTDYFHFIPELDKMKDKLDPDFNPDVCFFLDCGAQNRVMGDVVPPGFLVNIDHHQSNEHFGKLNYIDADATAVGEQIYNIITYLDELISKNIATCIYLSLMADSGSFRFSNTNRVTFAIVSRIVSLGAEPAKIAQAFYDNRTPESIAIKGDVLTRLKYECDKSLVWSEITNELYAANGGEKNEPDGLVGEMRGISGVEVSMLFHELREGGMRAGLRSKGNIDVSRIAVQLGGGGHPNASGCYVKGNYLELRDKLLSIAIKHISRK
jgi:bifunctional oligoribonuclease and PAP phosphatase NrnA